jgi:hypothetical protein
VAPSLQLTLANSGTKVVVYTLTVNDYAMSAYADIGNADLLSGCGRRC